MAKAKKEKQPRRRSGGRGARAPGSSDGEPPVETGRPAQRRRTRRAIVEAAMELLASSDGVPSAAEFAAAAEVSRRTLYLYFPTLDQLVIDASLGLISQAETDREIELSGDDAEARAVALAGELQTMSPEAERLGRRVIALTVEATDDPDGSPRRGYRRVGWIEDALAPIREEIGPEHFERLVSALAMVIGFEARIVARDVRGLDVEDGADASRWAAAALVRTALAEAAADGRRSTTHLRHRVTS